jgi:hypothetical protein
MRTSVIVALLVLTAIAVPLVFSEDASANGEVELTISGLVRDINTGHPLPGVSVLIVYADSETVGEVFTDADGKYEIIAELADSGDYRILFRLNEYVLKLYIDYDSKMSVLGSAANINISCPGPVEIYMDAFMDNTPADITGTVVRNGSPVGAGVRVIAHDSDLGKEYRTVTLSNGSFSIKDVPVGAEYLVFVDHPRYEAENPQLTGTLGGDMVLPDLILVPKPGSTFLFGLDFTHSLMVIGGVVGLMLMVLIASYRIHIGKHPELSRMYFEQKGKNQE